MDSKLNVNESGDIPDTPGLDSPLPKRDPADGCSFDFDLETDQALLDNLNWEEYHNPIEDQKDTEFDSNLSSPTDWAHDWHEQQDW